MPLFKGLAKRLGLAHDKNLEVKGIDNLSTARYTKGMAEEQITLTVLKCQRCGYKWIPRQPKKPKACAGCNSPYWDKPRRQKGVKKP